MTRRTLSLGVLAALSLSGCKPGDASSGAASNPATDAATSSPLRSGFDEGWDREFQRACPPQMTEEGIPRPVAVAMCRCMGAKANERLTTTEKITGSEPKMEAIANECVREVAS